MNPNIYNDVKETARQAEANGQTIEINYSLPYICVNTGFEEYFFQGQEAEEMIESAKNSELHNYCSIESIILWEAQGW